MDIAVFTIALLVLFYSGGVMVRSLTWLGRYFEMSEYALSLVLVAFATSLPELFVGVSSAITGTQDLSLGDLIGANVLNVTLVMGVAMLFAGKHLVFERGESSRKDIYVTTALLALPALLIADGTLSRPDGLVLLLAFAAYVFDVLKEERVSPPVDDTEANIFTFRRFLDQVGLFIFAALLLVGSAHILVSTAQSVALSYGIGLFSLGILVAVGTTLPEVVFSARSVFLGHSSMSLGNALGSVVFNITFILGLVAFMSPFTIADPLSVIGVVLLPILFIMLLQAIGILRGHFSRALGIILIFVSAVFIITEGGF